MTGIRIAGSGETACVPISHVRRDTLTRPAVVSADGAVGPLMAGRNHAGIVIISNEENDFGATSNGDVSSKRK